MNFLLVFILLSFLSINLLECSRFKVSPSSTSPTTKTKVNPKEDFYYTVIKVADGDTITLKNNTDGKTIRIRFLCIDAPEKSQGRWGDLSLKKLAELLPIKSQVTLEGSTIDVYGRTLSNVINSKKISVNLKMVELGLAVVYPFQKGCDHYKEVEAKVKKAKTGVWSDAKFEMPWNYRKNAGIGLRGSMASNSATKPTNTYRQEHKIGMRGSSTTPNTASKPTNNPNFKKDQKGSTFTNLVTKQEASTSKIKRSSH